MKYLFFVVITGVMIASCKKDDVPHEANISVNVINASPGISNAKVKTTNANGYYSQLSGVNYGNFAVFTMAQSSPTISISSSTDTTHVLYSNSIPTSADKTGSSTVYSLFIAGAAGEDMLLNPDNIPYHPDSSLGVRVINLSKNSNPVNVTLSTSTTANEFSGISYKTITDFKNYAAATASPNSYTFQFRDATTNAVLGSFAMNNINNGTGGNTSPNAYRFRNFTLVLMGVPGSQSVFVVNNY